MRQLVGGGSVINGADPSNFQYIIPKYGILRCNLFNITSKQGFFFHCALPWKHTKHCEMR